MREIKLKPIIISFMIVLALLAGGSFMYQYVAQQKPLEQSLEDLQFSQMMKPIEKHEGSYQINIEVTESNRLIDAIHEINDVMNHYKIEPNSFKIILRGQGDELQKIWQKQLFYIAEVMANQSYSKLPQFMQLIEEQYEDVTAIADMDERNVYITLLQEDERYDAVLPLDGGKMEVWSTDEN